MINVQKRGHENSSSRKKKEEKREEVFQLKSIYCPSRGKYKSRGNLKLYDYAKTLGQVFKTLQAEETIEYKALYEKKLVD